MSTKINPAYRLYQIISKAANTHQDNQQTLGVWAHIFALLEVDQPHRDFQVTEGINLVFNELQLTQTMMARTDFTEALYQPSLDSVRNALSVTLLPAAWNSVRSQLGPQIVNDIRWCSEVLPSEECLITSEVLSQLLDDLADLEKTVTESELPAHFTSLIMRHISAIRHSVRWYPVTGIKGLEEEIHKAYGEIQANKGTMESIRADVPVKSKFMRAWIRFMAIVKKAGGMVETAERLNKLAHTGRELLEFFEEFTSGNSAGPMPPPGSIV